MVYSNCQCSSAFFLSDLLFRIALWPSVGKELSPWLFTCAVFCCCFVFCFLFFLSFFLFFVFFVFFVVVFFVCFFKCRLNCRCPFPVRCLGQDVEFDCISS